MLIDLFMLIYVVGKASNQQQTIVIKFLRTQKLYMDFLLCRVCQLLQLPCGQRSIDKESTCMIMDAGKSQVCRMSRQGRDPGEAMV